MTGSPNWAPKFAGVGDRERAALHLVGVQLLDPRAVGHVLDGTRQAEQVLLVGALDDRHDQAVVERHGDAEVDRAAIDDVVAVDRGVEHRVTAQAVDRRLGDERREGELRALALVVVLLGLADLVDAAVVDLEHRVDVRRGVLAEHHVLGDLLAHHRHRLDAVAGQPHRCRRGRGRPGSGGRRGRGHRRRGSGGALLDELEDVVLGHAAAGARAADVADVHAVFLGDAAHERRGPLSAAVAVAGSGGRRGRGGGRCRGRWRHGLRRFRLPDGGCGQRRLGCGRDRRGRRVGGLRPGGADRRHDAVDGHRLAFLDGDLEQHAGRRRRDLRVHLVGRDLEQRLVAVDAVADLLDPPDDRALGNRLAHLGHHNWSGHGQFLDGRRSQPAWRRRPGLGARDRQM